MKGCINTLLPTITRIVNWSFNEACIPEILKQLAGEPRIMKPMLDNELLSSYRPISNLRFISKAIEKVAADRLNCNLINNDRHELLQSAYKQAIALKLHCFRHISRIEIRLYVLRVSQRPVRIFLIIVSPRIRTWSSPILTIHCITECP